MRGDERKGERAGFSYDQGTGQAEQWGKVGRKQQGHGSSWPWGTRMLAISCRESSSKMGEG